MNTRLYRLFQRSNRRAVLALAIAAAIGSMQALPGQSLDASALRGDYQMVRLEIEQTGDSAVQARNTTGKISFDGQGAYELQSGSLDAAGTYAVRADGSVSLDDPSRTGIEIQGLLGADLNLLAGVALEADTGLVDLFLTVRAAAPLAEDVLQGDYALGAFQVPGSDPAALGSALVTFRADGEGGLSDIEEIGHFRGERNQLRSSEPSVYRVLEDGSIEADLSGLNHPGGLLTLWVSADGSYVLGLPSDGTPGIFVGVRQLDADLPSSFVGLYSTARIGFDGASFNSGIGSVVLRRGDDALTSRRLRLPNGVLDFSGRSTLVLNDNGGGWLSRQPFAGGTNMVIGVADSVFSANAAAGAEVDVSGTISEEFGAFLLLRPPLPELKQGLFVDVRGVVHGASFARPPAPMAQGLLATIFGASLIAPGGPAQAAAGEVPLPTELAGVRVTVNGIPAPLIFVSGAQMNLQIPVETEPGIATLRISNGEEEIQIPVRVAETSPGLFFYGAGHSDYAAIVTHGDGSLVTPANPARPGETVVFWSTGLGLTNPPVPTGHPSPGAAGEELARPIDAEISLLVAGFPATIHFVGRTPGFVGLTQINATIPLDAPLGDTVPVALLTGNAIQDQSDLPIGGAPVLTEERLPRSSNRSRQVRLSWEER